MIHYQHEDFQTSLLNHASYSDIYTDIVFSKRFKPYFLVDNISYIVHLFSIAFTH